MGEIILPRNVNLSADPNSIEGYFIKGLRAASLSNEQIEKQRWISTNDSIIKNTNNDDSVIKNKIKSFSDIALINEWYYWSQTTKQLKNLGGLNLTSAEEYKKECESEIDRRKIQVTGYNT